MSSKKSEWLAGDAQGIGRAAELLRWGELVAIPTETVYGLAARADSEEAVGEIYRAKGRPGFNPLIVHVGQVSLARELALFDSRADLLAEQFWPGPLTMVLPLRRSGLVAPAVTAGLPTIALRQPANPLAAALLQELDLPLAAPSANRSGSLSPTRPEHVASSLGAAPAAILDGGATDRGMESTIVALRPDGRWQLLRPGPVTEAQIARLLGPSAPLQEAKIEAPGQLARHYSPGKPVRLGATAAEVDEFMVGLGEVQGHCTLSPTGDLVEAATRLYACLHEAAASALPRVAVAPVPDEGLGVAINDRLRRAAAG